MSEPDPLLEKLKSEDRRTRAAAIDTLRTLGPDGTQILWAALRTDDFELFHRALNACFTLKQVWGAIPTLIEQFQSTNRDIRKTAIRIFGRLHRHAEPAIPHLCKALNSPDPVTLKVAAETLGKLGTTKAIRPLTDLLCDSSRIVRSPARFALSKILAKLAAPSGCTPAREVAESMSH